MACPPAFTPRDTCQVAFQVVAPGMVDAGEIPDIAAGVEATGRPAMPALILEGVNSAVGRTGYNNRRVPDARGFVVSRIRNLGPQANKFHVGPRKIAACSRS